MPSEAAVLSEDLWTRERTEWCHSTDDYVVTYCGLALPPDEPRCGVTQAYPRIGRCPVCGRPNCPDCVFAART